MSETKEVHVVMLPWLAFGHMIPFLDLSIALAKSGVHISFISTPKNIQRLPKIPQDLSKLIHFIPFSLPNSNNLPENAESTIDIPVDKMDDLKIACDNLQNPIKHFISEKSPNWIIADFFPHWAADIAQDLKIPLVTCYITTASTAVFFWAPELVDGDDENRKHARKSAKDLTLPPKCVEFPSQVFCRQHEANDMYNVLYGMNKSGIPDGARVAKLVNASRAVAIRTSMEFEGDYLKLYSEITKKPVFPLGFLPPPKILNAMRITNKQDGWTEIFDWLDEQKPCSVVFVSFGSEHKLKKQEIHEIAYGLEHSKLPFLWALRKPDWNDTDTDVLPLGFVDRTAGRGVVRIGWAPQREILGHPSIGGSLFHAGWASIIETAIHGHCLVLLPFVIAQPLDTRLLVEKGLAVEVERGEDGAFGRDDISSSLRKGMVLEKGERLRASIREAADGIFGNERLNDEYIVKFVEYLKNGIQE